MHIYEYLDNLLRQILMLDAALYENFKRIICNIRFWAFTCSGQATQNM